MTIGNPISAPILTMGQQARKAAQTLASIPGGARQQALELMAIRLQEAKTALTEANRADVAAAKAAGLAEPLVKRLEVSDKVFAYMTNRLREVAALPDPVGRILEGHTRPTGLRVEKVSVPIGVIGIIFESRPNVTTDAAAVCLKSGNAVILRGGSEALRTNLVLADAMSAAARESGLPENSIQIVRTPGHETVNDLLKLDKYIDVLIPRGGKGLIERIAQGTRIPVIKHYDGLCHLYLAPDAPADMAQDLVINSKCQRVEVCNALEKILIDAASAERLLLPLAEALTAKGVDIRGCARCNELLPTCAPAVEEDWSTEYLAPIITIKIVDNMTAAIDHINHYGSGHTDGIVSLRSDWIADFVNRVDSASVMVNASTRLSGGGDYGMGAVVGISTDKLHARGPVGCDQLTSTKWVAYGNGHLRN